MSLGGTARRLPGGPRAHGDGWPPRGPHTHQAYHGHGGRRVYGTVSLTACDASPCVLITYRKSGTAVASPVWFRFHDGGFEVVIAQSDVKLRRLQHRRDCSLLIFEATPPFRGVRVEGTPTLVPDHHHESRMAIAGRYLGRERAQTFVEQRREPGVVLRMSAEHARTWDLNAILPTA